MSAEGIERCVIPLFISGRHVKNSSFQPYLIMADISMYWSRSKIPKTTKKYSKWSYHWLVWHQSQMKPLQYPFDWSQAEFWSCRLQFHREYIEDIYFESWEIILENRASVQYGFIFSNRPRHSGNICGTRFPLSPVATWISLNEVYSIVVHKSIIQYRIWVRYELAMQTLRQNKNSKHI